MTAPSLSPPIEVAVSDNAHYPLNEIPEIAGYTRAAAVLDAFLDSATDSPHSRRAYGRHCRDALAVLGCNTLADLHGVGNGFATRARQVELALDLCRV